MYITDDETHNDPVKRWNLPDRIFFACGACHILAYAFLERYPDKGFSPIWMKPHNGFRGNHIVVVRGDLVFDYHGHSGWSNLRDHYKRKANRWWPGWRADFIPLPKHVLISESESKKIEGLWLREPKQFLHDAMPRAVAYLNRFPAPPRE